MHCQSLAADHGLLPLCDTCLGFADIPMYQHMSSRGSRAPLGRQALVRLTGPVWSSSSNARCLCKDTESQALRAQARDNLEARIKHADAPERFMDSEVDLDEAVRQLQAVASAPELYPELVRLGAVPEVVNLLGHENGDLAASVAELLRELTDTDAVEDSVQPLPRYTHAWHHQPAACFRWKFGQRAHRDPG